MAGTMTLGDIRTLRAGVAPKLPTAKVVERKNITPDLMTIKLEPQEGPLQFKAGQYCTLGLQGIERAYSIVSAPHERYLEIFVELMPDGELTPLMWEMKVGDTMSIRPRAKGLFVMNQRVHHHFMAATVTGVAPSISMVRSYLNQGAEGHQFYILLGASYQDELTYHKELAGLAAKHPDCIHFVPTISRPNEDRNAGWQGEKGRVNTIVEKCLERFHPPKNDTMVYACGHPGMIADVKERVSAQGWKFAEERFWKE